MSLQDGGGQPQQYREAISNGRNSALLRALHNANVAVLYQDCNLHYLWGHSVPSSLWRVDELAGSVDVDIMPSAEAERVRAAKEGVLSTGRSDRLEIQLPAPDGSRWFDLWIDADLGPDAQINGIVTTALEITERKRREQLLRALLREVSHRSKNLLAIIQSIAMQTGRYSFSINQFLTRFRGRIQSLASSQDLVTSSNWRGADLHQLIESQVALYCMDRDRSLLVSGENPHLNPNAALHIGLALHELAVNSVSYGALSRPHGQVKLTAELRHSDSSATSLLLNWTEEIGAGGEEVRHRRFGSVALERVVPASLNGTADLSIGPTKLKYSLNVPEGNFGLD